MIAFAFSETVYFVMLMLAYAHFRNFSTRGPSQAATLHLIAPGITSACLVASGYTLWRADRSLSKGNRSGFMQWMALTVLLGLAFLSGQGLEWHGLIQNTVTISRNLFGTTFFTLTGVHALHVAVGVVILLIIMFLVGKGNAKASRPDTMLAMTIFWDFTIIMWIATFSVIYLAQFG